MKIFFATDIHGSEICWKKFLNAAAFYKADMVVLGGDVTGKAMVPIIAGPGYWETRIRGELIRMETREDLIAVEQRIRDRGDIPCILNGGNDDIFDIDPIIENSPTVTFAEGKVLDLGGFSMVSMGWT